MKHARTIVRIVLTFAGWVAGLVTALAAVAWLLKPRRRAAVVPVFVVEPTARVASRPTATDDARRTPLPVPSPPVVPPRLKIGMVGMTRFVAALVIFATVATVAGMIGMARSQSSQYRQEAIALTGGDPTRGETAIQNYGCSSCHTIPGIRGADAQVGPPLTKVGGRMYIGGVLANTPENLVRWILNPPGVDTKTAMPNLHVTESDARDIACYLYTLR